VTMTSGRLAVAIVLGLVIGVTSAGSGALISVGLIFLFSLRPSRVVGTDLFHASIVLSTAALGMLSKAGVGIPSAVLTVAPAVVIAIVAGAVVREGPRVRSLAT